MKKTILAVAMTAAMASTGALAAEIYSGEHGSVEFGGHLRTQLQKIGDNDIKLNAGSSRASISAAYNITDSLDALGYVEFGLSGNGGAIENRLHYTGLSGDFGSVKFGRQWTVADDFGSADVSYFYGGLGNTTTSFTDGRHDSLVKYQGGFDAVTIAAAYGLSANSKDDDQATLAELSANVDLGMFTIGGVIGTADHETWVTEVDTANDTSTSYQADATYGTLLTTVSFDALTILAGVSTQAVEAGSGIDAELDSTGYQITATYDWSPKGTAYVGFESIEYDLSGAISEKETGSVAYVGTSYQFNSFSLFYVEVAKIDGYALNVSNDSATNLFALDENDETAFGAGFRVYW